jgi:hypothetical protein
MFDVNMVIGMGNNSVISTSKIMKITAIKKNRDENGSRAEFVCTVYIDHFLIYHVSKNQLPCLYFLTVLYLYVTSCELEWLTLTTVERHKNKIYFRITCSSSNCVFAYKAHIIHQITRYHAQDSNKVNSRKRTYNSNEVWRQPFSLIAPYV